VQGGLSARDANPINPFPKDAEAIQDVLQWNGRILLRTEDQGVVMAVRTAKVTTGKKEHRTKLSWPIQKGGL
jgi:hypothetical protein